VERRLATYEPVETDPAAERELFRIIRSGLVSQTELPAIPALPDASARAAALGADAPHRRANPRRGRTD
jgi:hypothetical protein